MERVGETQTNLELGEKERTRMRGGQIKPQVLVSAMDVQNQKESGLNLVRRRGRVWKINNSHRARWGLRV